MLMLEFGRARPGVVQPQLVRRFERVNAQEVSFDVVVVGCPCAKLRRDQQRKTIVTALTRRCDLGLRRRDFGLRSATAVSAVCPVRTAHRAVALATFHSGPREEYMREQTPTCLENFSNETICRDSPDWLVAGTAGTELWGFLSFSRHVRP